MNYTKGNLAATAYRTRKTDDWNFKYYRYDIRGRVIKMWNIIAGFDTLITYYSYNSQDQMTSYAHTNDGDDKTFIKTYDYAGRLSRVDYYTGPPGMPNPDEINLSEYDYNANSQVLQQRLNEGSLKNDYFYNNRNWVEEMIQSEGLFNYINGYYKNGNVKTQQLSGGYNEDFSISSDLSYTYNYDKSNRLTQSITPDKNYELQNTYDNDGNILSLERTNGVGSNSDNFSYVYYSGTNKLQRVSGAGNQFSYDANGNLIQDAFNNNNEILYDHRNLITELKHRSMIIDDTVYLTKYYYDEAGSRIRKMTYAYLGPITETEPPANSDVSNTNNWSIRNDEVYSRDISGRDLAIYKNNSVLEYPFYGLDMVGKIKEDELYFYLKDHLGSIRAVLYDNKIYSSQDYDAWGHILEGRTYQSEEGKFKFTGKERDEESFYDYFGARYYDSRIGRWGQVEPLIDKYPQYSPYCYAKNNSLTLKDIDGRDIIPIFFPDYKPESKGINFPVGHSGILLIDNETGHVNYYEYGAYDEGTWHGQVRRSNLENQGDQFSNIIFNENGNPTEESIQKVLQEIGGGKIEGAYIKTSIEETKVTREFLEYKLRESNPQSKEFNPNRKEYNTLSNNCSSFICEAVKKSGVFIPPTMIDIPQPVSTYLRILYKNVDYEPNK